MKIQIKKVENKPFETREGERKDYFWYVGVEEETRLAKRFGSKDGSHKVGETYDLLLEEDTSPQGKPWLKEVVL